MAKAMARFGGVAIALMLGACAGEGIESGGAPPMEAMDQKMADVAQVESAAGGQAAPPNANSQGEPAKQPSPTARRRQLIKTVNVSLRVDSVAETVDLVRAIAQKYQGDVLNLNDSQNGDRPSANITLSIPQDKLELALSDTTKLGQVENRNVSAEDVTTQLVDANARLRNLRRTESQFLKILERASAIKDVLAVTEQLNRTRQEIEQLDAQLKSLRERVAYSTLSISIQQKQAAIALDNPLGEQLGNTWGSATRSMGDLTVGLIKITLWLLAYTPYWILLVGLGWGTQKLLKRQKVQQANITKP